MDLAGKKLLLLGSSAKNVRYAKAAQKMGAYVIVTDNNPKGPVREIADEGLFISLFDTENLIQYCRNNHVDGVLCCNTNSQMTHYQICAALGLPSFGSYEAYRCLTDKEAFIKKCAEYGLNTIPQYSEEEKETIDFPVLVKPTDNSGSRGISVCYTQEELIEGIKKAKASSPSGKYLIEKYMRDFQDFTVTYLVIDGELYLLRIGDRNLGDESDDLSRENACAIYPSAFTERYLAAEEPKLRRMIQSLGIQNAPFFLQGFHDGNTVYWYDPGIRYPGSEYEYVLEKATGFNALDPLVAYCVTGSMSSYSSSIRQVYELKGKTGLNLVVLLRPGKIAVSEGWDEVRNMPEVVEQVICYSSGDMIPATGDSRQIISEVAMLVDRNPESAAAAIRSVQEKIRVLDTDGNDMIVSVFDPSRLKF